jgi:hypothetical protein
LRMCKMNSSFPILIAIVFTPEPSLLIEMHNMAACPALSLGHTGFKFGLSGYALGSSEYNIGSMIDSPTQRTVDHWSEMHNQIGLKRTLQIDSILKSYAPFFFSAQLVPLLLLVLLPD